MGGLVTLIVLAVLLVPVLVIALWVRTSRQRDRIEELERRVLLIKSLELQIRALESELRRERAGMAPPQEKPPAPPPAPPKPAPVVEPAPVAAPAPVVEPAPAAAMAPVAAPASVAAPPPLRPAPPPVVAREVPRPAPRRPSRTAQE